MATERYKKEEIDEALEELAIRLQGLQFVLSQIDYPEIEIDDGEMKNKIGDASYLKVGRIKKRC